MIKNVFTDFYEQEKLDMDMLGLGTRNVGYLINNGATYSGASSLSNSQLIEQVLDNRGNKSVQVAKLRSALYSKRRMQLLFQALIEYAKIDILDLLSESKVARALLAEIPHYNIIVEKAPESGRKYCRKTESGRGRKTESGSYCIYIEDAETHTKELINFERKASKILYAWFLLHPRTEINENDLRDNIKNIITLGKFLYAENTFGAESGIADEDLSKADYLNYYKYLSNGLAKLNDSVLQTLDKTDFPDDENWYLIMKDKETYSLSLFAECITIPDELRKVATE